MNRLLAGLLGLSVGIVTFLGTGPVSAQEGNFPSTVVNLPELDSGRNRDGVEVAQGDDGDSISYTIVENADSTGDATTAVHPEAPTPPDLSRVPVPADSGETTVAPPSGEPASAPVDGSQPDGVMGDATMADPAGEGTPLVASCADFASWYDSQVYYESVGGTAAAPELVNALDPDYDGVACEELIQFS